MKYFMVESSFNDPLPVDEPELKKSIKEHVDYLQKGFDEGWILVSGPKASAGGGMILLKGTSLNEIEEFFSKDPMKISGIQEYKIIEFKLHECQNILKDWFK
jgi:uncharacterized protein YciI